MVFSAATTFTVYWLARALYDRVTAAAAGALLAVSPLFWFYGSVGLTYAGEAFGASLMALLAYRTLAGSVPHLYLGARLSGPGGRACAVRARPPLPALRGLRSAGRARPRAAHRRRRRSWWPRCWPGSFPWCGCPAAGRRISAPPPSSTAPPWSPTSLLGGDLETTLPAGALRAGVGAGRAGAAGHRAGRPAVLRAPPRLGHPRVVPRGVDGAAPGRLHAGAFRAGGLRADHPARARHPAEPRGGGAGRRRRPSGSAARSGAGR